MELVPQLVTVLKEAVWLLEILVVIPMLNRIRTDPVVVEEAAELINILVKIHAMVQVRLEDVPEVYVKAEDVLLLITIPSLVHLTTAVGGTVNADQLITVEYV